VCVFCKLVTGTVNWYIPIFFPSKVVVLVVTACQELSLIAFASLQVKPDIIPIVFAEVY
jgi:hypothetical protein